VKKLAATLTVIGMAVIASSLSSCGGSSGKEGGTLTISFASYPESLDPQICYALEGWSALYDTYIPLLTYAHAEGEAGTEVVPGLAESLPKISDDGKTYTLTLRKGLKYSDGSPVKASDFKSTVERMFKLDSGGSYYYTGIVGAEEFQETKEGGIPGIETDDASGEITIHLVQPSGTFTYQLGLLFVAPVPASTPAKDQSANPPPATGPYAIVKSDPGKSWSYERNPQWAKNNADLMPDLPSGHVDKIEASVIRNQSTQVNDVEQGKTDWMFDPVPPDRIGSIRQRYEGTQFREVSSISTYFFWMNTTQPPFDDLKVRQAVNYAIDPAALERIYAGQMKATQQILPPGMPGYEQFVLYPHDIAKAKKLIAEADPSDREITVWTDNFSPSDDVGAYYQDVLEKLGFSAKLKVLNSDNYFTVIGNTSTPDLDTGWANWFVDYPNPSGFFEALAGSNIAPTNNINLAQIDVPSLNKKVERLDEQQLGPNQEKEFAALDREYMEQAPWAPYGNFTLSVFVSSEVELDKVIWNPTFSGDLASFQLK